MANATISNRAIRSLRERPGKYIKVGPRGVKINIKK